MRAERRLRVKSLLCDHLDPLTSLPPNSGRTMVRGIPVYGTTQLVIGGGRKPMTCSLLGSGITSLRLLGSPGPLLPFPTTLIEPWSEVSLPVSIAQTGLSHGVS